MEPVIELCYAAVNSMSDWVERYGQTVLIVLGFAIGILVMARYRWKTRDQKHVFVEMSEMPKS